MYKNEIKAYKEDLAVAALSAASTTGENAVEVDETLGGLVVNVFAKDNVTLAASKTAIVKVLGAQSSDGVFAEIASATFTGAKTYGPDELVGRISLPVETPKYLKATVTSSDTAGNTGNVRVTLGYLPR